MSEPMNMTTEMEVEEIQSHGKSAWGNSTDEPTTGMDREAEQIIEDVEHGASGVIGKIKGLFKKS